MTISYFTVPITSGVLDVNYHELIEGYDISSTQANVCLDTTENRSTWISITEATFKNKTLPLAKADKLTELEQAYYASFTTFTSSALGTTKTYPIDKEAQDNLEKLERRLIADSTKSTFYFKTIEDGTLVAHTRAQFLQLLQDAETFTVNQTTHFDSKAASVNSATDIPTVQAITW